ncbi:MAG: hypothetical protein CMO55_01505 [Verrucomicrobiales bacterium]|nr:hypothetical protein [Verrucomicrobiales bacterium]
MESVSKSSQSFSFRSAECLAVGLLLLTIVLVALPGMRSPIVLDDELQIAHVAQFSGVWDCFAQPDGFGFFRPFKNLIYYGLQEVAGGSMLIWHGVGMGIHLAAVGALYMLVRGMFGSWKYAVLAAAVWALTPSMTTAAIWLTCSNINLGIFFVCLFLLVHSRMQSCETGAVAMGIVSGLLLVLTLFSYESLVVAIGLVFFYDRLVLQAKFSRRQFAAYAAYGVIVLGYLGLRSVVGATYSTGGRGPGFAPDLTHWQLMVSAPWFLMKHLAMWLFPIDRIEFLSSYVWGKSATSGDLLVAWLVMIGGIVATVVSWKRNRLMAIGLLWFGAAMFPVSNFFPLYTAPVADYYLIIPSIGLAIVFAALARSVWTLRKSEVLNGPKVVAVVLLVALGGWRAIFVPLYPQQASLWNDPAALYVQAAQARPYQFLAQRLAAVELTNRQMPEEALMLAADSVRTAPWNGKGHLVAGFAMAQLNMNEEALASFREARRRNNLSPIQDRAALLEIARLHIAAGSFDAGREALLPLLEAEQDHEQRVPAILLMSKLYREQSNQEKAIATLEKGLGLYPNEPAILAQMSEFQTGGSAKGSNEGEVSGEETE